MRAYLASFVAASALSLGGCGYYDGVYGGAGYGYNDYGYRDYGYYDPYYYGGFGRPDYGSSSYYGWYGNSYYPGSGLYVYDRYRSPRVMTSGERSYWTSRQPRVVTTTGTARTRAVRQNWSGFNQRVANNNGRRSRDRSNQQ